jgi:nitroreductase
MKKAIISAAILFVLVFAPFIDAQETKAGIDVILNHYAAWNFIIGSIPRVDLDRIVQAGIRAPSADNRQPWLFTVVQNRNPAIKIMPSVTDGNVLIVISAANAAANGRVILDCALATESIYLAAQSLGYGSRIYTGPTVDGINRSLKGDLGIPLDHSAVAVVRVGKIQPGVDAVSAASSRKSVSEVVNYK